MAKIEALADAKREKAEGVKQVRPAGYLKKLVIILILVQIVDAYTSVVIEGIGSQIMLDLNSYRILWFQVIQNKIDQIDILVKLDEDLEKIKVSNQKIVQEIKNRFEKLCKSLVQVNIKQIDETNDNPFVISNVSKYEKTL